MIPEGNRQQAAGSGEPIGDRGCECRLCTPGAPGAPLIVRRGDAEAEDAVRRLARANNPAMAARADETTPPPLSRNGQMAMALASAARRLRDLRHELTKGALLDRTG